MKFTDLFIYRPVFATVISLLIFVVGLSSIASLSIRQYPEIDSAQVMVNTTYPGANQSLVQGFVTQPIESAIASVEGVDYITSTSTTGQSAIVVHLKLGYDVNAAVNDINAQVQSVKYLLPDAVQDPVVQKDANKSDAIMYLAYYSNTLSPGQITDYINRVIVPNLQTVPGVAQAAIIGGKKFAMRLWLNPSKMAAFHVTSQDIANALKNKNVLSAPGKLEGKYDEISILANTNLTTVSEFNNIILKTDHNKIVRLKDVGEAVLGSQNMDVNVKANGKNSAVVAISALSTANPLTVAAGVRKLLPQLKKEFPPAFHQILLHDASKFINESIDSVVRTIVEAIIIVLIVIFLFLGTLRAVIIPIVTIPLSLVGVCLFMLWLGFSINVLTLLAMVLAIGLVVDDAIVVVENISRHLEMGQPPMKAAIYGAREIAMPVVTMSITLAAVFIPIGFLGGLTGRLFTEFAFVLAATVVLSGVVALTLSPMMSSKLLKASSLETRFTKIIDRVFQRVVSVYRKMLLGTMNAKPVALVFTAIVLVACFFLYSSSKQTLAPQEDQGFMIVPSVAPSNANIDYTTKYVNQLSKIYQKMPDKQTDMTVAGMNGVDTGFSFLILNPYKTRENTVFTLQKSLNKQLAKVTGLKNFIILPPTLPGTSFGMPIQFVIQTINNYGVLNTVMQKLLSQARKSGLFIFMNSDLKYQKPQLNVNFNSDLASTLGINSVEIANALGIIFSNAYITRFDLAGRSYEVIPQAYRKDRWNPVAIKALYVNTSSNKQVPLSSLISMDYSVVPNGLNQFQQMNSATFSATPAPGVSTSEALTFLKNTAKEILPPGMTYNYDGQLRQFVEQPGVAYIFGFAIIFIFLILAALFESFREPLIILVSVPLCLFVALLLINVGLGSINIFTKIGLVTLIGLIAKQGILIVDFANKKQETDGLSIDEAVIEAACIRLRPILMTTAAMFFGVLPLLFTDAGLIRSEHQLAMVIMSGILFGTFFTIFVVPVFYHYLATKKKKIELID